MDASMRFVRLIDGIAPPRLDWPTCPWQPADFLPSHLRGSESPEITETKDGQAPGRADI